MARKKKNSIVLYTDYLVQLQALSMEQRGILMTALLNHQASIDLPEMDALTNMCFLFMSADINRANEQYEEVSKNRQAAARKRWMQMHAIDTSASEKIRYDTLREDTLSKDTIREGDNNIRNPPAFIPSVDEAQEYITEQSKRKHVRPDFTAERFLNYYNARNWTINGTQLTDWKALVDSWLEKSEGGVQQTETDEDMKRRIALLQ